MKNANPNALENSLRLKFISNANRENFIINEEKVYRQILGPLWFTRGFNLFDRE